MLNFTSPIMSSLTSPRSFIGLHTFASCLCLIRSLFSRFASFSSSLVLFHYSQHVCKLLCRSWITFMNKYTYTWLLCAHILCCFAVFRLNSCALQGFLVQGALLRKSEVDGVLERALEVLPGQLGSTLIPTLCLYSLLGQQQSLKQEVMLHSINSYFLSLFFLAFKFGIV